MTRVTPSGVLVYDGEPHTPEWFAARSGGITATDMVKIMGFSKYGDSLDVWATKRGQVGEDGGSEAAEWGLIHEPSIDRKWAERHCTTTHPVGVLANVDHPHYRASLDRIVEVCPDGESPCGLQIKTRSAFQADDWRRDVPDDVYVQEQWEMLVTGYRHMHVACLIGGNRLVSWRVDRDEDDIASLVDAAEHVWACVQSGDVPSRTKVSRASGDRVWPSREGQAEIEVGTAVVLLANWKDAKAEEAAANRVAKAAKAARLDAEESMVAVLGPARCAFVGEQPVFEYVANKRDGYTVAPTTFYTVKINKDFEENR